jgi:hypothetical protein
VFRLHQAQHSLIARLATARKKIDGRITAGLHTAAPQAMRMGIPPFFCVAVNKKWSKPRAPEYREMLLILLQTERFFAILKSRNVFSVKLHLFTSQKGITSETNHLISIKYRFGVDLALPM